MAVPGRREYRLTLYPSRDRTEWRLVRVDWAYGSPTYTRVASGSLPLSVRGRRGYLQDLWRVLHQLERLWSTRLEPEAPREPLGGGGGDQPLPSMDWAFDVISQGGLPLDKDEEQP